MTETKKAKGGNQIIRLALILFLVSAITSGVLGFVNALTKDTIEEQERIKTEQAYNAVLPYDGGYTTVEGYDPQAFAGYTINAIAQAGDEGWVVELTFSGAQGSITAAFGVSAEDYSITGASVIDHAETSGLGFMLAIVLFASVRDRLQFADYPESYEGFPIALTTAGLLALAFMGFSGMSIA